MTREEAIRRLSQYAKYACGTWRDGESDIDALAMAIQALQSEPEHGKWEECKNGWRCTACGKRSERLSDFCPNCGADMRG